MKTECENAILEYAPIIRQLNAAMEGEHKDYVEKVLIIFRDHYRRLKADGATEWTAPPQDLLDYLDDNKPY